MKMNNHLQISETWKKLLLTQALQSGSAKSPAGGRSTNGYLWAVIRNETGEVKGKQVWVKSR